MFSGSVAGIAPGNVPGFAVAELIGAGPAAAFDGPLRPVTIA